MSLRAYGVSATGVRHLEQERANEDRFLVADLTKILRVLHSNISPEPLGLLQDLRGHILAVADGVGGSEHGAESSELASEILTGYLLHTLPWFVGLQPSSESNFADELRRAFETCHQALVSRGKKQDNGSYVTTLTLAYVAWRRLYVAHVGDSRCYVYQNGSLVRTTTDQTMAQQFIDDGSVEPGDAEASPLANVLTSAIGASSSLSVQVIRANLRAGDRVLLSSDGVHGKINDEAIAETLAAEADDEVACGVLLKKAIAAGSLDDATCVLATFIESDDGPGMSDVSEL